MNLLPHLTPRSLLTHTLRSSQSSNRRSLYQQEDLNYLKGVPRTEHKLSDGSLDPKSKALLSHKP